MELGERMASLAFQPAETQAVPCETFAHADALAGTPTR
jgi:hypothetical protein